MTKWEYIELRLFNAGSFPKPCIQFMPGYKIDQEDLKKFFSQWKSAKFELDNGTGQLRIFLPSNELNSAYAVASDYLGQLEWEAYSKESSGGNVVDIRTSFKRVVGDKNN